MVHNYLTISSNNDLENLETDSSFSEIFGDSNYFCSPWSQDVSTIRELNECTDTTYFPQLVPKSQTWKPKSFSIINQLKELYHEELRQTSGTQILEGRQSSYLLSKLVQRERFNMVIVTLHPENDGYSVRFSLDCGETIEEDAKYPYTQDALLEYIDNEQLPTPFLDYWEESLPQLFYDGCVIVQVNDLRHGPPASINHVLLRPHNHSLIGDISKLLMDSDQLWAPEEQFTIECNIINNANRSLCLDPSPDVGKRMLKIHQDRHAFDNRSIRKLLLRNSPLTQQRKRKYEHLLPRANSFLSDFIESKKANSSSATKSTLPVTDIEIRATIPRLREFSSPREILNEVCKFAKPLESQPDSDDFTPHLIKEWILENKIASNTYHVRLTILQRPVNFEYLCQIYMDNKYVEGKSNGSTCRFTLGSRANAHRFVKQYIELYTAEGRQKVNITQLGPGQIIK